jgi:hypothetical protein
MGTRLNPCPSLGWALSCSKWSTGANPVFITLGEPQAHGDTTKVVP